MAGGEPDLRASRVLPRRVALVVALVLLLHAVVLALLAHGAGEGRLHRAPVALVAPAVVGQALAAEVHALPGRPFDVVPVEGRREALRSVRGGTVVAALVVDLRTTEDRLVLHPRRHAQLNRAVLHQVREVERARGRTVALDLLPPGDVAGQPTVNRLALSAGILGFALVVALSLRFGPVARTLRLGVLRLVALAVAAGVLGYAAAVASAVPERLHLPVAGILAVALLVAGALTLALEGVAGLAGLGVAAALFLALATRPLLGTDPLLLPDLWRSATRWSPSGATFEALTAVAVFDGVGAVRPLLVLATWLVVAVVALAVARRERGAAVRVSASRGAGRVRVWRLRVAATVVPLAVAMLLVVAQVPRDAVAEPVPTVDRATETRCVATGGRPDSVADLNRIADRLRGGPEFQGADVGADAVLQDGRRLMVFGDTLRGEDFDGQRFVRNSMLLLGRGCLRAVLPADRGAVIPDRPVVDGQPAVGYWPMSVGAVHRPGYDLVAVTAQRVRTTGTGAFDFENLGPAVAVFVVPRGETPQLVTVRDVGTDSAAAHRPTWGAASAMDGGWVYLYGTVRPDEPLVFGFSLHLARVRPDDILEPSRWRYWDGTRWGTDADRAAPLIAADGGVSQTLSVFEQDGRWHALSKRNELLGDEITVWSADHPWGPFDGGRAVATLPTDAATGELRYMPLAHPGLVPRKGTVVVSYSRNRLDVSQVVENPFLYRPRFLRVDLP